MKTQMKKYQTGGAKPKAKTAAQLKAEGAAMKKKGEAMKKTGQAMKAVGKYDPMSMASRAVSNMNKGMATGANIASKAGSLGMKAASAGAGRVTKGAVNTAKAINNSNVVRNTAKLAGKAAAAGAGEIAKGAVNYGNSKLKELSNAGKAIANSPTSKAVAKVMFGIDSPKPGAKKSEVKKKTTPAPVKTEVKKVEAKKVETKKEPVKKVVKKVTKLPEVTVSADAKPLAPISASKAAESLTSSVSRPTVELAKSTSVKSPSTTAPAEKKLGDRIRAKFAEAAANRRERRAEKAESKSDKMKMGGAMKKMKTGGMVNPNATVKRQAVAGSKGVMSGVNPKATASSVARGRVGGTSAAPKTATPKAKYGMSMTKMKKR